MKSKRYCQRKVSIISCKKYDISEYEVLGLVKKLKDEGINVTYSEKNKDAYIIINDHPDFTKENDYYITEDVDSNTKIAFISILDLVLKMNKLQF